MARPVFTSVSTATRPRVSSAMIASRTPSLIWSATLSGWPSVTDSEVKRKSLGMAGFRGAAKGAGHYRSATSQDFQGHGLEQFTRIRPEPGLHHLVRRESTTQPRPAGQGREPRRDRRG